MFYDDLPLRGFIGTVDYIDKTDEELEKTYYLFLHLNFHILYNDDKIIYANVTADPQRIHKLGNSGDEVIEFTYSATWEETGNTIN